MYYIHSFYDSLLYTYIRSNFCIYFNFHVSFVTVNCQVIKTFFLHYLTAEFIAFFVTMSGLRAVPTVVNYPWPMKIILKRHSWKKKKQFKISKKFHCYFWSLYSPIAIISMISNYCLHFMFLNFCLWTAVYEFFFISRKTIKIPS